MPVYVKIPNPVPIYERIPDSDGMMKPHKVRTMTMSDVIDWLTNDNHFASPAKMGKVAAELIAEFDQAKVGSYVKLTSEQADHIKKVLEKPSTPYLAIINKQIVSLINALAEPLTEEQYKKETANDAVAPVPNGQSESSVV